MPPATILVPLDGSPVGEAALPFAAALARRTGASIRLVRAAHATESEAAETYLKGVAANLDERAPQVATHVAQASPPEGIHDEIASGHVGLVVMATHDRTGPRRWAQGSVAEAVVSQATAPVLLVRANQDRSAAERFDRPAPTLVVPLDGSAFAESALAAASDIASAMDGTLVLVRVVPAEGHLVSQGNSFLATAIEESVDVVTPGVERDFRQLEGEARSYLADVASRLGKQAVADTHVRHGEVATEILFEAEDRDAAAVVMATHGRTGVARTVLGSVAGKIVHEGTFPVLLVRPK